MKRVMSGLAALGTVVAMLAIPVSARMSRPVWNFGGGPGVM
ncbi:MAG TPA: hypothetical protein VME22_14040 [Solirubrobacteraceae bacterium]|nr:hypothetical protein [Solirubrobacteraceae bacterium]